MELVYFKVLVIPLAVSESIFFSREAGKNLLRIKVGRRVMFSNVGTLDQCKEWIEYWISLPTCRKYEHTYTLYPKDPDILQD